MVSVKPNAVKITGEDIASFERELRVKLPPDYAVFLEVYNGGYPESNLLEFDDADISVQVFYGLKVETMDDLRGRVEVLAGRVPPKCQAIAALEGGDALLMALDRWHYGRIYWWEHEIEQTRLRHMRLVARSFTELMERLKPYNPDEADLSGYQVEEVSGDPDSRPESEE